jgi:hypothetical protein
MKRLLSMMTLLAFAVVLFTVSGATASPVIDPPAPPLLVPTVSHPLTDGWYSAALQQTRLNAAKKHPVYRASAPTLKFGLNSIYVNGCLNGTIPDRTMGGGNNDYEYYGNTCT